MKRFFVLLLVLFAIFLIFEAGLYIAGLVPQDRILESIQDSLAQLETEYEKPYVLHNRNRNGIDNFTDCLMLNLSYFMNTNSEPSSILGNPLYWEDNLEPFEELKLLSSGQIANGNYLNYCMGYRLYLRPMLSLLNYMEIRNAFIFVTWMLFGLSLISVSLATKNNWFAALYTLCIVSLNPVAISGSLTLMICFILAFMGVLFIPYVNATRWRLGIPILFLFLGALTQFFDFYTYPLITFAFPMIVLLLMNINGTKENSTGASFTLMISGLAVWLMGYVGIWLIKLAATHVFTTNDVLSNAIFVVNNSIGLRTGSEGFIQTLFACIDNIFTPEVKITFIAVLLIWLVLFIQNKNRNAMIRESWVFLAVGAISLLWIVFSKRMYIHRFFQYRILGVFMMGLFAFAAQTMRRRKDSHP